MSSCQPPLCHPPIRYREKQSLWLDTSDPHSAMTPYCHPRGLRIDQGNDGLSILGRWVVPVFLDCGPRTPGDLRRTRCHRSTSEHDRDAATPSGSPQARPALHHVKRVIGESQFLDTLFHNVGEVLKGVNEILMARHAALAEAGIVGATTNGWASRGSDSGTC
jgi:hypothetical protein